MSNTNHTPGPWEAIEIDDGTIHKYGIVCSNDPLGTKANDICAVWLRGGMKKTEANARLIAAAPELLEALEMVMDKYSKHLDNFAFEQCHQAIAKATGK